MSVRKVTAPHNHHAFLCATRRIQVASRDAIARVLGVDNHEAL
jgi:hypothetical protein